MSKELADSLFFSGVDQHDLSLIEAIGQPSTVSKGTFLFFQDDPAERFYVILSGKIKIGKTSPDGKEQILLMAGPGDSFGEAALFAKRKYPADAEAVEPCELVSFTYEKFMALIRDHPSIAVNIIAGLSMRMHHLTRLIQRISLEDVSTRLAGYILGLLPAEKLRDEETVTLTEKKMVMASMLGTIPETLSRAFAKLSKLGVISIDGQKIQILDRARLEEIASGEKI
jgi:CRP/FNR family transcriptional regulator